MWHQFSRRPICFRLLRLSSCPSLPSFPSHIAQVVRSGRSTTSRFITPFNLELGRKGASVTKGYSVRMIEPDTIPRPPLRVTSGKVRGIIHGSFVLHHETYQVSLTPLECHDSVGSPAMSGFLRCISDIIIAGSPRHMLHRLDKFTDLATRKKPIRFFCFLAEQKTVFFSADVCSIVRETRMSQRCFLYKCKHCTLGHDGSSTRSSTNMWKVVVSTNEERKRS